MKASQEMIANLSEASFRAKDRLDSFITPTRLARSIEMSRRGGNEVFFKFETENLTGSFKIRGALNKLLILREEGNDEVVTASTGNHALAVAQAGQLLGIKVNIFVPKNISPAKLEKLETYNVEINLLGSDGIDAERAARECSERDDSPYVSPYNDLDVVAGQGTIAIEILEQLKDVNKVYLSLGGGGLAGGIGAVLQQTNQDIELVAASPRNSPVMARSIEKGEIIDFHSLPTISDGTAGGLESDSVTFPLCQSVISRHIELQEDDIREACKYLNFEEGIRAEGAAALALAGLQKDPRHSQDERVVVILCGSNIDEKDLRQLG